MLKSCSSNTNSNLLLTQSYSSRQRLILTLFAVHVLVGKLKICHITSNIKSNKKRYSIYLYENNLLFFFQRSTCEHDTSIILDLIKNIIILGILLTEVDIVSLQRSSAPAPAPAPKMERRFCSRSNSQKGPALPLPLLTKKSVALLAAPLLL